MCDIVAQSIIFGLVNGIFNYGSVYLLCGGDAATIPSFCPNPADVNVMNFIYGFFAMFILYFVISWISNSLFGNNPAMKILLLTLVAVFGVLFYMSYIGKPENVSLLSLVIMLVVSYLIFWVIEFISQWIGGAICGPNITALNIMPTAPNLSNSIFLGRQY